MIDHLPFLHSQTHFYSFHSCDSVILVFVFLHFLYISLFILECSKFNRLLYDYFVVTRAEIWSKFIEYPFLISYKDIVIKRINSHKKNQYARTGFFVWDISQKFSGYAVSKNMLLWSLLIRTYPCVKIKNCIVASINICITI